MIQLSYVSSASQPVTAAGLLSILQQCYGHNPLHDITGCCCMATRVSAGAGGCRGRRRPALREDRTRSSSLAVTCISRKQIETRHFPGWSMSFRRLSDDFDSGPITGEGARETLLRHFAKQPSRGHCRKRRLPKSSPRSRNSAKPCVAPKAALRSLASPSRTSPRRTQRDDLATPRASYAASRSGRSTGYNG